MAKHKNVFGRVWACHCLGKTFNGCIAINWARRGAPLHDETCMGIASLPYSYFYPPFCIDTLPAHAAVSTDSLVGYWKFDETSGTTAADASGDGNTGTHTNGPTISTDVSSTISFTNPRSLSFDGTND